MSPVSWLLQNALVGAAATGVLLVTFRFWRPAPAVEHLLWLAVAVKLLLPPVATLPVSTGADETLRGSGFESWFQVVAVHAGSREGAGGPAVDRGPSPRVRSGFEADPDRPRLGPGAGDGGRPEAPWAWMLVGVWGLGGLASAATTLARYLRFRRDLDPGRPSGPLRATVEEVARDVGVDPPRVVTSPRVSAPMIVGVLRPLLVWPEDGRLRRRGWRTVIAHELAHLRPGDLWSRPVELLADVVWWFYPVWWLTRQRLRDASERACDASVVATYPAERRVYADALLDVLSAASHRRCHGLGLVRGSAGRVKRRLEVVLAARPGQGGWTGRAAAVFLFAALVPSWTSAVPSPGASREATATTSSSRSPAVKVAGVASRGAVRFRRGRGLPTLGPDGWFVAFSAAEGPMRELEMRREGSGPASVLYRVAGRSVPPDSGVAPWLQEVLQRTGYDPGSTRPGKAATAAWVPAGRHSHRTDGEETLGVWWSAGPGPAGRDAAESPSRAGDPLFLTYQADPGSPVVTLDLRGSTGATRLLDASVDAAPVTGAEARRWLHEVLARARAWSLLQ